jgi:hypothetical protein
MDDTGTFLNWSVWKIWLLCLALVLLLTGSVGKTITGHMRGFLLDKRNKYSLSQLQAVVWTMVILSSLATIVLAYGSLKIALSGDLLALMGISFASLGGSLVIKDQQAKPDQETVDAAPAALPDGVERQGRLARNHEDTRARWSDIFRAEILEESIENKLDFGKFQLFLVSLIVVVGYVLVIFKEGFGTEDALALPALSQEVITMIAISHAGYLGLKVSK